MFDKTDTEDIMLAEIQGNIFEKSCEMGLESKPFIRNYMQSQAAFNLDLPHHKIRWCGEMHLLSEFLREKEIPVGKVWNGDLMFWIGYIYRYWHCLTKQSSRKIYQIADEELMAGMYPKFHTESPLAAINGILRFSAFSK